MKKQVFLKISIFRNFANFSGKHLRSETPSDLTCNFIKKRLQQKCFPVKDLTVPFPT